jgi:hypothetical protein
MLSTVKSLNNTSASYVLKANYYKMTAYYPIQFFRFSLCCFFILLTSPLLAQTSATKPQKTSTHPAVDADILAIRKAFQRINALKLNPQRFTYEKEGCVEDGKVNFYLNNKEIVKITESGSIGDGSWMNEYYYAAGKVIFCFESLIGGPAIGPVSKSQYRYYIKNGKPIRVMEGSKVIPVDSKATEILHTATEIYKAYSTKDFASAICK